MASPPALPVPPPLLWLLVAPGALWAAVRLTGLERGALPIQLVAFTPYVAAVSLIPLVVALVARNWPAVAVAGLACLALAAGVLPRAFGSGSDQAGLPLTVMSLNLRLGGADPAAVVQLVRDRRVDVLTLQEYSESAGPALTAAGLAALLPYAERHPAALARGSAVYSRFPLSGGALGFNAGFGFEQARAVVHLDDSVVVTVESVHPVPPVDIGDWTGSLRAQSPAPTDGLRVLAGDFNATLDHAELRRILDTGYRDAASAVGAGLVTTWPYYGPRSTVTPKIAIDHILVNGAIGVRDFTAVRVAWTDHRAIIATLILPAAPPPPR